MQHRRPRKRTVKIILIIFICIIPVTFFITIFSLLIGNESNSLTRQLDVVPDITFDQKLKIMDIFTECNIFDVKSISYEEELEGLFTYNENDGYGTEDGYRVTTKKYDNIIMYMENGELLALRYANYTLYSNNTFIIKITEINNSHSIRGY